MADDFLYEYTCDILIAIKNFTFDFQPVGAAREVHTAYLEFRAPSRFALADYIGQVRAFLEPHRVPGSPLNSYNVPFNELDLLFSNWRGKDGEIAIYIEDVVDISDYRVRLKEDGEVIDDLTINAMAGLKRALDGYDEGNGIDPNLDETLNLEIIRDQIYPE